MSEKLYLRFERQTYSIETEVIEAHRQQRIQNTLSNGGIPRQDRTALVKAMKGLTVKDWLRQMDWKELRPCLKIESIPKTRSLEEQWRDNRVVISDRPGS